MEIDGDDSPGGQWRFLRTMCSPRLCLPACKPCFLDPGQQAFIDLIWAPVTDVVDLEGYNVYRHEEGAPPYEGECSAIDQTPAYRDASGGRLGSKKYLYSVSAVDVRGNESAPSEEANEAVP